MDREEGDEIAGARARACVRAWPAWGVGGWVGRRKGGSVSGCAARVRARPPHHQRACVRACVRACMGWGGGGEWQRKLARASLVVRVRTACACVCGGRRTGGCICAHPRVLWGAACACMHASVDGWARACVGGRGDKGGEGAPGGKERKLRWERLRVRVRVRVSHHRGTRDVSDSDSPPARAGPGRTRGLPVTVPISGTPEVTVPETARSVPSPSQPSH